MTDVSINVSPSAWEDALLGEILVDIQPGFASGKHSSDGEGLPHLRPMNVTREGHIDRSDMRLISPVLADRDARRLRRGDVLFNNTNSLALVGKTALFQDDDEPAFSNHMTRLRVRKEVVDPAFVAHFLHMLWETAVFQQLANNHVSQASISQAALKRLPIMFPPLVEQQRIIEFLAGVESRRSRIAAHLCASRRTVFGLNKAAMSAACIGQLTDEWRGRNPDVESVEQALRGVERQERRKRRSPESIVDLELPTLPPRYVLTTVGAASFVLQYGTSKRCDASPDSGVPVLRMGNIQAERLEFEDLKFCVESPELERLLLADGDLLFNRTNSPELVGKSAVFRGSRRMSFASYLIRVRFDPAVADPEFVNLWINSSFGRYWASLVKTDGVSQSNINGTKLASMPLPLPPLLEQKEIVRQTTAISVLADSLVARIGHAEETLDRLHRTFHSRALCGELGAVEDTLAKNESRNSNAYACV